MYAIKRNSTYVQSMSGVLTMSPISKLKSYFDSASANFSYVNSTPSNELAAWLRLFTISTSASDSFLALIFGLAVSDPTPNLSLSLLVTSVSHAFIAWFFRECRAHTQSLSLSLSVASVSRALAASFFWECRAHTQSLSLSVKSLSCALAAWFFQDCRGGPGQNSENSTKP